VIEAGLEALTVVLSPDRLLFVVLGVGVGLIIGLLPGLGGTVGMSILLPFIFGMDPVSGIGLLMGMAAVVHTGDTFPSVLLGVPGSSGSQATIMDGYPLAQQGEAARALGAAFFVSMIGGLIGAVALFGTISIARPLVTALGSPELFMLTLLGLSMVGVLARGSAVAGLLAGLFGMIIGTIGAAPGAPVYRYTLGQLYLYDGIPIAVLALGLFALPEMIDLLAANRSIARAQGLGGKRLDGVKDALKHRWLVVRSSIMGAALGVVPGVGGAVVDWLVYGVTQQTSRDNENFGKGDIRGVIGPESANNAKEGGSLIPTLLFGIPGSGTTAILLGGLILLGIQAGPTMVTDDLDVTLSIIWTLAIANVLGAGACFLLSGYIARISLIPAAKLVPFLLVIMVVASYQSTRHWGDIIAFFVIGLIGWVMKQLGWPRAPMLIGFVLALSAERYLHISMSRYGADWLLRPAVIVIGVLTLLVIFGGAALKTRRQVGKEAASADEDTTTASVGISPRREED
jgi:putative tricarboxylic transport membrane protein